jgi:hypothetical protein
MCSKYAPRIIEAIEPTGQFFLRPHSVVLTFPRRNKKSGGKRSQKITASRS